MQLNDFLVDIHGKKTLDNFVPSSSYTGELFGVAYLFSQSNLQFPYGDQLDVEIDEGFGDCDEDSIDDSNHPLSVDTDATISPPTDEESSGDEVSCMPFTVKQFIKPHAMASLLH